MVDVTQYDFKEGAFHYLESKEAYYDPRWCCERLDDECCCCPKALRLSCRAIKGRPIETWPPSMRAKYKDIYRALFPGSAAEKDSTKFSAMQGLMCGVSIDVEVERTIVNPVSATKTGNDCFIRWWEVDDFPLSPFTSWGQKPNEWFEYDRRIKDLAILEALLSRLAGELVKERAKEQPDSEVLDRLQAEFERTSSLIKKVEGQGGGLDELGLEPEELQALRLPIDDVNDLLSCDWKMLFTPGLLHGPTERFPYFELQSPGVDRLRIGALDTPFTNARRTDPVFSRLDIQVVLETGCRSKKCTCREVWAHAELYTALEWDMKGDRLKRCDVEVFLSDGVCPGQVSPEAGRKAILSDRVEWGRVKSGLPDELEGRFRDFIESKKGRAMGTNAKTRCSPS